MKEENIRQYRRDYRRYSKAWFFGLILLVPAGLVTGALVSGKYTWMEGLGSGIFFAVILFLLMLSTFRKMDKSWKGRVVAKSTKEIYGTRTQGRRKKRVLLRTAYRLEVRTEAGRKETVEVHGGAFPLFQEGDELVKQKGMPFPDWVPHPGETRRMCVSCGRPFDIGAKECPSCRFRYE